MFEYAMNRYFRGQAMVAGSVGILLAIGFKIIGLPMGMPPKRRIPVRICNSLIGWKYRNRR